MLFVTWPESRLSAHRRPRPTRLWRLRPRRHRAELFTRICRVEVPDGRDRLRSGHPEGRAGPRSFDKYQGVRLSLKGRTGEVPSPYTCRWTSASATMFTRRRRARPSRAMLPGLPTANILMYPPETVVAEKFEAMIRFGEANEAGSG